MRSLLILVHSPLVGPATWESVAAVIRGRGHEVAVPDLTASVTGGPLYWRHQVEAIAASACDRSTILVAHSGAGPLLGAARQVVERVEGCVFVDAGLPTPGQSWFETVPPELAAQLREMAVDGWLPPWSQWWGPDGPAELLADADVRERFAAGCPRLPVAMFSETHPPAPGWQHGPGAYLRLSDTYQEPAERARALGWPVTELATHHLAPLTEPELIADSLLDLVARLDEGDQRTPAARETAAGDPA